VTDGFTRADMLYLAEMGEAAFARQTGYGNFDCRGCGADTVAIREYYMLEDAVWLEANGSDAGMLCIGCVEERLGRRLTVADFTVAPVNWEPDRWRSRRLQDRLYLGIGLA
jgi:hypothetical protein